MCYNINYRIWAGTNDYAPATFCTAANCPGLYGPSCSPCLCANTPCFSGAGGNGSSLFVNPFLLIIVFSRVHILAFFSSLSFRRKHPALCNAGSNASASWPSTVGGSSAVFICSAGYFSSNNKVNCTWNGVSSNWDRNPCEAVYCSAGETDSVSWPSTLSGTFFIFSCKDGYYSALPCSTVLCVQDGGSADWATLLSCQGYCFYRTFYCERVFENWHTVSFCSRLPRRF